MDSSLDLTTNSYNQNAGIYNEFRPLVKPVIRQLDKFIELLSQEKTVLDIGCGPGRDASYFNSRNVNVIAIDLSDELLKIAKENVENVQFMKMDMRTLTFPNDKFDGLWVNTSFLHLPKVDAPATLRGFHRVLKSEGVIFLGIQSHQNEKGVVIDKYSDSELLISTPDFGHNNPRLFSFYNLNEITDLLKQNGFEVLEATTNEELDTKIIWLNIFARKLL